MDALIQFIMDKQAKQTMAALGIKNPGGAFPPPCPFNVGDTIGFLGNEALVYKVIHRHLQHQADGSVTWKLAVRPGPNPVLDDATYAPSQG